MYPESGGKLGNGGYNSVAVAAVSVIRFQERRTRGTNSDLVFAAHFTLESETSASKSGLKRGR